MNRGELVFAQVMQHVPLSTFRRCVLRYQGERNVQSFSCLDQAPEKTGDGSRFFDAPKKRGWASFSAATTGRDETRPRFLARVEKTRPVPGFRARVEKTRPVPGFRRRVDARPGVPPPAPAGGVTF